MREQKSGYKVVKTGARKRHGLHTHQHLTSESSIHQVIVGDYQLLFQHVHRSSSLARKTYVDIATDTLHASSSDLITWNTLLMMRLQWIDKIPRQWIEITTQSLEEWTARDETHPFLPDNRRGYARVTPVALSKAGIPGSKILVLDDYPLHGLGLYENLESWEQYAGYVWDSCTTKAVQSVHIDPAARTPSDD